MTCNTGTSSTRTSDVSDLDRKNLVYHYTTGESIESILTHRILRTEQKNFREKFGPNVPWRHLPENTFDFVWLTRQKSYPYCLYPTAREVEWGTMVLNKKRVTSDLLSILSDGIWRIGFPVTDSRLKYWLSTSEYRRKRSGMALKVFRQFNESWYDDYTQWYVSPEDLTLDFESVNSLERLVPDSGNGHWVQVDPEKISEVRLNYYNFVQSLISNPPRIQEKEWTVNWDGVIVTDNMMVCKSIQNTGKKLSFPPVLVKESPFWGMNLNGIQIEGAA